MLLCCAGATLRAAVTVTAGTGGTGICSNKAVTGSAPAFTALNPIVVTEGANADFSIGTDVIILHPPSGWQFSTTLPTITYITGSNISGVTRSITSSALTINVTVVNNNGADQITISGLQVQPNTTSAATGNIIAASVSGVAGISTGTGGTNFATLSVAAPVTASVSISASPSGSFCPGTNITFTPTVVNGGSPTLTWAVNGTDISIGSTYSNSTLSSGNTVSCRMVSSLGCLVANPVYSNTITATVLSAPAAITGGNIVCPGTTTSFSTTSTGGAWSSSSTAVATVSSSGLVTGVLAGTANISYTASGCAATRTIFVNNPPFAPALSPTVTTMCNGTSIAITAAGTPASSTILSQNFNTGVAPWTVDTIGSINILPGSEWKACADSYLNEQGWYRSPDFSSFMMANADTSGSASTLSTRLISPSFSLAEYSSATLTFQHAYDYWPAGDMNVNLEISTNGGSTWTTITNFTGATIGGKMAFVSQTFSLNSYLGASNVKIRFYYRSNFGYYWALDNVVITGTPAVVTPTWSPATHLYTNSGLTTAYTTGTAASTVYVYPTTIVTPTVITYTATATSSAGGCTASTTSIVTINPVPGTTSGSLNLCIGSTSTLTNSAAGGTWLSSNTSIATVGSSTGIVSGITTGTAIISYITGSGCATLATVTVNSTAAAISGSLNVCMGYPSTLASATSGGTWTSSNTAVATVGTSSGIVSGVTLGTSRITYTLGGGCTTTTVVTIHAVPAAITGTLTVCATQTVTLANATPTGIWVSGATGIATVGYTTGIVTGVAGGTANISYAIPTTGCFSIATVTVNALGAISGTGNACLGATLTLENTATGGTWTSSNTTIATIGSATGILNGLSLGTTIITYVAPTGCTTSRVITVNPLPADISGASTVCAGNTITLSSATTGGTWSSGSPAIAGVIAGTGVVTGAAAGTAVITYTAATGCFKTYTVTVNPPPAAITGSAQICVGLTSLLSNATGGGTWSSSHPSIAPVVSGTVTGTSGGTAVITYTLPTGCYATRSVTVNTLPAAITGTTNVCQGLNTTLSNAVSGGTWSSSSTVIATIGSTSGIVLGGASGTSTIIYTLPTGCIATVVLTVNTLPGSITGSSTVCTGATTTLATTSTGGTWSSSNTGLATVVSTGAVTGIASGNPTITYTLPTGCIATRVMTVYPSPASISGSASVCQDLTTTLSSTTGGGAWYSGNTAVATVVTATGVVTGIAAGTTEISYLLSTGCLATVIATVLPLPATITGNLNVCQGATSTLGNTTTGGTWSSSSTGIATIGATTGIVSGVTLGMTTISYTLATGCYATAIAVVNPMPSAITGTAAVCVGSSILLANATGGGTWSSSNNSIANASSGGGVITGAAAGTADISYILPTGCAATRIVTVNPVPGSITGPNNICQTASATLTNSSAGGVWTSSTTTVATIGTSTGNMYGVAGGGVVITYTLPTGCYTVMAVTITALPAPIAGASAVCEGGTMLYVNSTSGGSWSSGNPAVATISSAGLVTGVVAGTTTMTYMLPIGCVATKTVTVNPLPAAIVGTTNLCLGIPATLTNTTPGGNWSSSNTIIATINTTTGVVTGSVYGTAVITYTLPTGCYTTTAATVALTPSAISGANAVCNGLSTLYTNVVSGGAWSTGSAGIATVSTSGIVSGVAPGIATITYTLSTGCYTTKNITVNPIPAPITGAPAICQGLSATLSSATTGGTWTSSNTFIAAIGATTGAVFGNSSGTSVITYIFSTGCLTTTVLTVHALPAPLTGSGNACIGSTTTLSTTTGGGTWSSNNESVATIDAGGVITGINTGTATITYTLGLGCISVRTITVNPLPPAITGSTTSCLGINIILSNTATGGTWSSTTAPGIATVNATTGVVSPVSPGTATITYTLGTGCFATTTVLINTVSPIIGNTGICAGSLSMLTHATTGGTWSSSNTVIAGISGASGTMVGYSSGTSVISYIIPGGCIATKVATVSVLPAAISGSGSVCPAFSITLTNATPGGTWSSSNTSIASVPATPGIVTGVNPGLVTISYTMPSGCGVTRVITVNPLPAAISGTTSICVGSSVTLTSGVSGGTWSSSNTAIASAGATTGIVSGLASGTAAISYTPLAGCVAVTIVTVNSVPVTISGATALCAGNSGVLTNATPGGVWSSTNTTVATIGSATGSINGLAPGTSTISYTLGIGCVTTVIVTVNNMPSAIAGVASSCVGYTTSLSSTPAGGVWTSSNTGVATIDAGSGLVNGLASGTSAITYGFSTGCRVSLVLTVSPVPATVSGTTTLCVGASTTLSDPAAGGGTWSSANTAIATVGSGTGVVTGTGAGTTIITYAIGSGCTTTTTITVNPVPAPITGIPSACIGLNTSLSNTTPGGTWTSAATGIATIGGSTGLVSGISAGTTNVFYILPTGCFAIQNITVNPMPGIISGTANICAGLTTTLVNSAAGGVWSSGNTTVASVNATTGVVTGLSGGTSVITYLMGAGCLATTTVTVYPLPMAISGSTSVCQGQNITLSNSTSGGNWSSSNTAIGSIGLSSGILTGISAGTATVTYTIGTGCITTTVVTVHPLAANTGAVNTCIGFSTILSNTLSGGTWSSSNPPVAMVAAGTGMVTGLSSGTTLISYTLGTGCTSVSTVVVSALSPITGASNVCVGLITPLTNASAGGTWSSSNVSVATVGAPSGVVTGISTGTATVSYTYGGGCIATTIVTVQPLSNIAGAGTVCAGQTSTLTNATSGGTWSSSNTAVASVGSSTGAVSGLTAGTTIISYQLATGCIATKTITVHPLSPISGSDNVCRGASITLSNATPGGTWSSSNTAVATAIAVTGDINGIAAGTATISYILPTGCFATSAITVNGLPSAISGTANVCIGNNTNLSNTTSGGTWSSSNTSIADIVGTGTTGTVTGISAGTAHVSYTLATGCYTIKVVSVNSLPGAITGTLQVCAGLTTTLSNSIAGGTWSTSSMAIATVNSGTGLVTGVDAGTTQITYTLGTGCSALATITVNPAPLPVTGADNICEGATTILSSASTGGTWSSSLPTVAIGIISGAATGVSSGTAIVTYALPTGCVRTLPVTVNPVPVAISGILQVCAGLTTSLSNATPGGTWLSATPSIAAVDVATGVVSGISTGTATISYIVGSGCYATAEITVNPLPGFITGTASVCQGLTTLLSSASTGGTWSSGTTPIATVGATGIVTGITSGTSLITYTLPTGCINTVVVSVNPLPTPISGSGLVCAGQSITLSSTSPGGLWISDITAVATADATTGIITGISAGTATISYTLSTGCLRTKVVTVNVSPVSISGPSQVCTGAAVTLTNTTAGGTWSSTSPGVATISASGVVSGITTGTTTIYYSLITGCRATFTISVNPIPPAITGAVNICPGGTATLSNIVAGGTWSSSATGVATVDASTGVVTGITNGLAVILYTLPTGCFTNAVMIINPPPAPVTGIAAACQGATATLSNATVGGTWISAAPGIASVGTLSGIVTGMTSGTAIISYVLPTGCAATRVFTVNPLPPAITGTTVGCLSTTTLLANAVPGGTWSSSDPSVAVIGAATGIITGIALGTATVTYTLPTGCRTSTTITVYAPPPAITGTTHICQGASTVLSNPTSGGIWSSSNPLVATVGAGTGVVASLSAGATLISYTLSTGCGAAVTVTVDPLVPITGSNNVCANDTVLYANGVPGGVWSSSTPTVATVSVTGQVYGVAPGVAVISYALSTGCLATRTLSVNQLPAPYIVTGGGPFCTGSAGVPVGLSGSVIGFGYQLYNGLFPATYLTGTGMPLNFGNQSAGGTYTVRAANFVTGCSRIMLGAVGVTPVLFGPAAVSIATSTGDTVCNGTSVTFSPLTYLGGSTPAYQWLVNGALVSGATSYAYTPLSGDVVTCRLQSSASCASPDTASSTLIMTVLPPVTPSVSIAVTPNDTICQLSAASFAATPVNGGSSPAFWWTKNGVYADTGYTYSYTPADGDLINCMMAGNARCRVTDTVYSSNIDMRVLPYATPSVTINASPGFSIGYGEEVTFTADVANAGSTPAYQWKINNAAIPGATNASFVYSSFAHHDTVNCSVTSSGLCSDITTTASRVIEIKNVGVTENGLDAGQLVLLPNPNNGQFTIKGRVNVSGNATLHIQVTDILGQVVFEKSINATNGFINEPLSISNKLANGMYTLNLLSDATNKVFHFVVKR